MGPARGIRKIRASVLINFGTVALALRDPAVQRGAAMVALAGRVRVHAATEVSVRSTRHEAFAGQDELRYTGFTPQ